jgi:hypothetical protein
MSNTIFGPGFNRQTGLIKPERQPDLPLSWYEYELGLWPFGRHPKEHGEILETRITARSDESEHWPGTCSEWDFRFTAEGLATHLQNLEDQEGLKDQGDGVCLCHYDPIYKHCHIHNRVTGRWAVVGSCCIENFMGIAVTPIIQALERIEEDTSNAMREYLITFVARQGWLTDWEIKFCMGTKRKRKLTGKQLAHRERINRKVIAAHDARRRNPADRGAEYLLPF